MQNTRIALTWIEAWGGESVGGGSDQAAGQSKAITWSLKGVKRGEGVTFVQFLNSIQTLSQCPFLGPSLGDRRHKVGKKNILLPHQWPSPCPNWVPRLNCSEVGEQELLSRSLF